jgi:hypothetical protein
VDTPHVRQALLRTRVILDDDVDAPVAVNVEEPWTCTLGQLAAP